MTVFNVPSSLFSDTVHSLVSLKKSTPPQNRQLDMLISSDDAEKKSQIERERENKILGGGATSRGYILTMY